MTGRLTAGLPPAPPRGSSAPEIRRRPYWIYPDVAAVPLASSVKFVPADPKQPVVEIEDPTDFRGIPGFQSDWDHDPSLGEVREFIASRRFSIFEEITRGEWLVLVVEKHVG